jgi:hypothetical protein
MMISMTAVTRFTPGIVSGFASIGAKPMFEAFRTPRDQKEHLLYDGGHGIPRVELIKQTLNWLDRFQPVAAPAAPAAKR